MTKDYKMAMDKNLVRGHSNVTDKALYFSDIRYFNIITRIMTDNMMLNTS